MQPVFKYIFFNLMRNKFLLIVMFVSEIFLFEKKSRGSLTGIDLRLIEHQVDTLLPRHPAFNRCFYIQYLFDKSSEGRRKCFM